MLEAFCIEWSSQREDSGWTFDPKVWYWLKWYKTSSQHRGIRSHPTT